MGNRWSLEVVRIWFLCESRVYRHVWQWQWPGDGTMIRLACLDDEGGFGSHLECRRASADVAAFCPRWLSAAGHRLSLIFPPLLISHVLEMLA